MTEQEGVGQESAISSDAKRKLLQQDYTYESEPKGEHWLLVLLCQRIPFLKGLLSSLDKTGATLTKVTSLYNTSASVSHAVRGFQFANVVIAFFNMLRIPAIYISCAVLGEKIPFTLGNNVKLALSAGVFALGLAAFLIPGAAIPIAMAAGVAVLGISAFSLVNHVRLERKVDRQLTEIDEQIKHGEIELEHLKKVSKGVTNDDKLNDLYEKALFIRTQLDELHHQKETRLAEKARLSVPAFADKTVAVGVSAMALLGTGLALAFPPAGLAVVLSSCFVGGVYMLGRTALAFLGPKQSIKNAPIKVNVIKKPELTETTQRKDSTLAIYEQLFPVGSKKHLGESVKELHQEHEVVKTAKDFLSHIVREKDFKVAILFLIRLGNYLSTHEVNEADVKHLFSHFKQFPEALPIIKRALDDEHLDLDTRQCLNKIPQVEKYLETKEVMHLTELAIPAAPSGPKGPVRTHL